MSPEEILSGGNGIQIHYSFRETSFGQILIASTDKGICFLAFGKNKSILLSELKARFPQAGFSENSDEMQEHAMIVFNENPEFTYPVKLHLKGTPFQFKVWEALLEIPKGYLTSYGDLAASIGHPGASRAVGTAVGENPIAFIIPCHRVIRSTGAIGGYHWGLETKKAILIRETKG